MSLAPGQIIDAKYRVVRLIGEGGMGTVYEGENSRIGRRVAIKVLHAQVASLPEFVERFEREARAAARIGSPHVCDVLDLGDLPNGDRYIVMEYLDGVSFEDRIAQRGKLTSAQIAPIAFELLEGLGTMHNARVIHRDLKPANVFLSRTSGGRGEVVKILDFGVAKLLPMAGEVGTMTRTGMMMGTPLYMSPEQARGAREVDGRTDIYAASVMFYRALTGVLPYNAETLNELLFKIVLEDPKPLRELAPEVDEVFAAIIHKGLARDVNARFATAREYQEAIAAWGKAQGRTSLSFAVTMPSEPPVTQSAPAIPVASAVAAQAVSAMTGSNAGTPVAWSGEGGAGDTPLSQSAETVLTPLGTQSTAPATAQKTSEPGLPVASSANHVPAAAAVVPSVSGGTLASPLPVGTSGVASNVPAQPEVVLATTGPAANKPSAPRESGGRSKGAIIAAVAGASVVAAVAIFALTRAGSTSSPPMAPAGMTPVVAASSAASDPIDPSASASMIAKQPAPPASAEGAPTAPLASAESAPAPSSASVPRTAPAVPRHVSGVPTARTANTANTATTAPAAIVTATAPVAATTVTTPPPAASATGPKPAASARKFRTNLD